jgi:hypothetical protein
MVEARHKNPAYTRSLASVVRFTSTKEVITSKIEFPDT